MGARDSAVTHETRNIFLESAFFSPLSVRRTSRRYSLGSDSSYRFERGVDPEAVVKVLDEAAVMISKICGGEIVPGRIEKGNIPSVPAVINIKKTAPKEILGFEVSSQELREILHKLGGIAEETDKEFVYRPPSHRGDLRE